MKPYFQTEVIEEVANQAIAKSESEINEFVTRYLKDPNSEEEPFLITSQLKVYQTISDYSIQQLRPNYEELYENVL